MANTVIINGKTYEGVKIYRGALASDPTKFVLYIDTEDGTLDPAKMARGMKGYSKGVEVVGTATEIGEISQILDISKPSYNVPEGFVDGGSVSIVPETKRVTPTKSAQTVSPSSGKVLSSVSVAKIPDKYQDVSKVNAVAGDVVKGKIIVNSLGEEVTGTHTDPVITLEDGVLTIV